MNRTKAKLRRLERYDIAMEQFQRWLVESPDHIHTLRTLQAHVDGESLNAGTPIGMELCSISGLREQLRRNKLRANTGDRATPEGVAWRDVVSKVLTALDVASGDTDPAIDADLTDEEVRDEYPEIWACQQLASLLAASSPRAPLPSPLSGKYGDVLTPFVALMEGELHANASKGDRPGWLKMTPAVGMLEIYYHAAKLQKAVKDGDAAGIREYAADVANMSMMLVDVCGALVNTKEAA